MWTRGRHHLDRTLKTIERVTFPVCHDFKALVGLISAKFALRHKQLLLFQQ